MDRTIEPVAVTVGGQELRFLLSHGSVRRIKRRYKARQWREVVEQIQEDEDPLPLLYECLVDAEGKPDKHGMTEDQFADAIPFAETHKLNAALGAMLQQMLPEPRPTMEAGQEMTTGLASGDLPASDSP